MTKTSMVVAGIDTAKDKLDVAIHGQDKYWRVENNPKGWRQVRSELTKAKVERVGIEATGGYERGVVRLLREAGFTEIRAWSPRDEENWPQDWSWAEHLSLNLRAERPS